MHKTYENDLHFILEIHRKYEIAIFNEYGAFLLTVTLGFNDTYKIQVKVHNETIFLFSLVGPLGEESCLISLIKVIKLSYSHRV